MIGDLNLHVDSKSGVDASRSCSVVDCRGPIHEQGHARAVTTERVKFHYGMNSLCV